MRERVEDTNEGWDLEGERGGRVEGAYEAGRGLTEQRDGEREGANEVGGTGSGEKMLG
jgi:hypothetical protein